MNGVAGFVKDRLYEYNGTKSVILDGNELESCADVESCPQCIDNANCTMGYVGAELVHFQNHQASQG